MRLSVVFELLLVFLFLAFAAARVIDQKSVTKNVKKVQKTTTLRQGPPNRYCACTSKMCNCCRDFSLPVVPIKGPGCASIMYVQRDTMMVTMSFGDRVLSNTTISGKTPKPICMALPGGISQFCGRVYGISRKGDQFRACLGLELRALDDIEAALRVSCFKFGPKGVKLESAPPVPVETSGKDPEEEEDDDEYDLDDDDDDDLIGFEDDDDDGGSNEVDSDSADYTGFSVLGEDLLGTLFSDDSGSSGTKKKKSNKKTQPKPQELGLRLSTTTRRPILTNIRRSTVRPESATKRPLVNRLTKRPRPTISRPQIIQRPSATVATIPYVIRSTTSSPTTHLNKNTAPKQPATSSPTSQTSAQTHKISTTTNSLEKVQGPTEVTHAPVNKTEAPVTFTIPTEKLDVVKNEIKIPQTDLEKVEAVAAIAQQDVSGVISSNGLTSSEPQKSHEMVTIRYENIIPASTQEETVTYMPTVTEKINSVKFVPTTVFTVRPGTEAQSSSIETVKIVTSSESVTHNTKIKDSVHKQQNTVPSNTHNYQQKEDQKDEVVKEEAENNYEKEKEHVQVSVLNNKMKHTSGVKNGNVNSVKIKQSVKPQNNQNKKKEEEEEEDEEEEFLEGILSDSDSEDDIKEIEQEKVTTDNSVKGQNLSVKKKKPAVQNEVSEEEDNGSDNDEDEEDEDEEEGDEDDDDDENEEEDEVAQILGETAVPNKKVKPVKIANKKKPPADDNKSEEDEDEDEEEEEEDLLSVLEEDEEGSDEDSDDESEDEKNKKKVTPSGVKIEKPGVTEPVTYTVITKKPPAQHSTQSVIKNKPSSQQVTQTILTKKPVVQQVTETVYSKKPVTQQSAQTTYAEKPQMQITYIQKPTTHYSSQTSTIQKPSNQQSTQTFTIEKPQNQQSTQTIYIQKPITQQSTQTVYVQKPSTQHSTETTYLLKPVVQTGSTKISEATQTLITKKPATNTEEESVTNQKTTETVTEKIFMYQQPTEKVIIYQPPETNVPEKVFIYQEPPNKITQENTEKIIIYQQPAEPSTEKYIIYEPVQQVNEVIFANQDDKHSEEDVNTEVEYDDENSSEEESDDDSEPEQQTLMASIIKDRPVFSNKYAEEHDLTEGDDIDIEDSEGEENDYEEERKLKGSGKKETVKGSTAKQVVDSSNTKILGLKSLLNQRKKHYELHKDGPISTSRTHRRMNLDKLLQSSPTLF